MRWIVFLIFGWLLILLQSTVGRVLMFDSAFGAIGPDLLAPLAVFIALYARSATDAMLAAWVLGFALDATTAGVAGASAVIGPMPIAYALAVRALLAVREAFFRRRALTRMVLTLLFCLFVHGLWVTLQSLLARQFVTWGDYGRMLLQVAAVSVYSALVAPAMLWIITKRQRWLIAAPAGRSRRR